MNKKPNIINSNLITIDIARGFAALSVFIYHYGVGSVLEKATGWTAFNAVSIPGAIYAVPLFFAVSGFCIHWSQLRQEQRQENNSLNYKSYIWRRFWRIYPTYLVALLFSCAVQAMASQKIDVWDFFVHVSLLQGFSVAGFNSINLVLWTISIEAIFYLLYPIWYKFRNHLGLNRSVILGLFVSLSSWVVCALWMFPYSLPEQWFALNLWGAWLVSAWLAEQMVRNKGIFLQPIWWLIGFTAIFVTAVCREFHFFAGRGEIILPSIYIILWIWPLSALILAEKWLWGCSQQWWWLIIKALGICGQFSYSLYLLHLPLMALRNLLWSDIHLGIARSAIWLIALLATLGISWLSYQVFERPFIQYRINKSN